MEEPREANSKSRLDRLPDEIFLIVLQFCHNNDIKNTRAYQSKEVRQCTTTTSIAVDIQNMKNMNWIKERSSNGCFLVSKTFHSAARTGNIEIMEWLKKNECPWDSNTFAAAATYSAAALPIEQNCSY